MIRVRGLTKTYPLAQGGPPVTALRGVSFDVAAGDFVAIMGTSGSGKSTLLNLLGCLDRPTSGTYELDGTNVGALDADARAGIRNARIGFVFQSFNLLPRTTALENVALPLLYGDVPMREHDERAREALASVGLAGTENRFPSQLSGGQQQRVAMARALVTRPRLLLADEPTGNLDSTTSRDVMALLSQLNRGGRTVVVVTHEPAVAALAARVLVLRDGEVVSDRPAAELPT